MKKSYRCFHESREPVAGLSIHTRSEKNKPDTSHSGTKGSFFCKDPLKFNQKDPRICELYWGINKPYSRAYSGGHSTLCYVSR